MRRQQPFTRLLETPRLDPEAELSPASQAVTPTEVMIRTVAFLGLMGSSNRGSLCKALLSGRTCAGFRVVFAVGASGSFAVRFGIYLVPLCGYASGVCACRLQSRRADASAGHRSAAAADVCRSTQTGLAAYSSPAPFAQTRPRSPRGCADAVHRARGA